MAIQTRLTQTGWGGRPYAGFVAKAETFDVSEVPQVFPPAKSGVQGGASGPMGPNV